MTDTTLEALAKAIIAEAGTAIAELRQRISELEAQLKTTPASDEPELTWWDGVVDDSYAHPASEYAAIAQDRTGYICACNIKGEYITGGTLLHHDGDSALGINPDLPFSLDECGYLIDPDLTRIREFVKQHKGAK
jgi:hypothetical protein